MINYKSLIKKNLLNKYKNSTKFDKNFLNSFFLHRENILKKINLFKIIYHENDHTFSDLLSSIASLIDDIAPAFRAHALRATPLFTSQ